jgi:hypothetical protein
MVNKGVFYVLSLIQVSSFLQLGRGAVCPIWTARFDAC